MLKLSFFFGKRKKFYFLVNHVTLALNFPLLIFLIFKFPADLLLCKHFPLHLLKLPLSFFLLFFFSLNAHLINSQEVLHTKSPCFKIFLLIRSLKKELLRFKKKILPRILSAQTSHYLF